MNYIWGGGCMGCMGCIGDREMAELEAWQGQSWAQLQVSIWDMGQGQSWGTVTGLASGTWGKAKAGAQLQVSI